MKFDNNLLDSNIAIRKIKNLLSGIDIHSITFLAIILLFGFTVVYCYLIFQQFSFVEVVWAAGLYLLLVLGVARLLGHKFELSHLRYEFYFALLLALFLVLLMTMPLGIHHADYFRTFPILEAEQGVGTVLRGWYDDTVFHVAIIQSILNFGYPSIGQHGSPLMVYHVISHYFDALIILVTRLDPFDSYGMFAVLKRFALLSTLCLLVSRITVRMPIIALFGFVVFVPLNIDMWLPVISHGLWMPTIIFLATLPMIFQMLFEKERNSAADLSIFFAVAIVISFGKVSFGFIYAAFIGFVILFKQPKSFEIYILGALWLLFFYVYSLNMPIESSAMHGLNFDNLKLSGMATLIASSHWVAYTLVFLVWPALTVGWQTKRQYYHFALSSLAIFVCISVVSLATNLGPADKGYFQLAAYTILLAYAFMLLCLNMPDHTVNIRGMLLGKRTVYMLLIAVMCVYILANISTFSEKFLERNKEPFRVMNNTLIQPNLSLLSSIKNWSDRGWFISESGQLYLFKNQLEEIIRNSGLSRSELALFVPSEVYLQLPHDYGDKWAAGMFLYSLTGVPLLNAIKDEQVRGYGIYLYGNNAMRKQAKDFELEESCMISGAKQVLVVEAFSPLIVDQQTCINNIRNKVKLDD